MREELKTTPKVFCTQPAEEFAFFIPPLVYTSLCSVSNLTKLETQQITQMREGNDECIKRGRAMNILFFILSKLMTWRAL